MFIVILKLIGLVLLLVPTWLGVLAVSARRWPAAPVS
jgi:hypothetical protein